MKSNVVSEYVRRLSDDTLFELRNRIRQDLEGDKAAVCNILAQDKEVDRWLLKATNAEDFYEMMDQVEEAVMREYGRRDQEKPRRR
ncbi:MAG: hypothetical protein M0R80_02260 [Proteobacteria bacterium]|jgi:hypothetical protein|nr:hypothetical protein [Pseudomonadota bacterium]